MTDILFPPPKRGKTGMSVFLLSDRKTRSYRNREYGGNAMIIIIQFTSREDRMPDRDVITLPFGSQPSRGCPDEIKTWEFGSTLKKEPEPQLIPRNYGTQHF